MTEMREVCGICKCGAKLDTRIKNPKKGEHPLWLIYGICEKEKKVMVHAFFFDKEPIQNVDFFINPKKQVELTPNTGEKQNGK